MKEVFRIIENRTYILWKRPLKRKIGDNYTRI